MKSQYTTSTRRRSASDTPIHKFAAIMCWLATAAPPPPPPSTCSGRTSERQHNGRWRTIKQTWNRRSLYTTFWLPTTASSRRLRERLNGPFKGHPLRLTAFSTNRASISHSPPKWSYTRHYWWFNVSPKRSRETYMGFKQGLTCSTTSITF